MVDTHQNIHWINDYLNETNRPIRIYYQINQGILCYTEHGIWKKNGVFSSVLFDINANEQAIYNHNCSGGGLPIQKNIWHNDDTGRVFL